MTSNSKWCYDFCYWKTDKKIKTFLKIFLNFYRHHDHLFCPVKSRKPEKPLVVKQHFDHNIEDFSLQKCVFPKMKTIVIEV